jgi:enterochelin esterase-like enzyme
MKSAQMGNERKFWIYTPLQYTDKGLGNYGLIVLFDGFSYLHWVPVPTILDNLIHAGKIPPIVAVLVEQNESHHAADVNENQQHANPANTRNVIIPAVRAG